MSYVALYRKWRPIVFEDVVGQNHIVETLRNTVISGRISHAYLFSGTRGTGKTSVARIFARAINCLAPENGDPCNKCSVCLDILAGSSLDVIEIDAASNNGVDNIRDIRDEVAYTPATAKYKVYIIDEVHMLSTGAFNALLKTLEEPPAHAVFFLATTEPQKLPATILSRCQKYDFKRIAIGEMIERLQRIADASGMKMDDEAALIIARTADGAMRDAISVLDQCISRSEGDVRGEDVLRVTGMFGGEFLAEMADAMIAGNTSAVMGMVDKMIMMGKEVSRFVNDMILYFRDMLFSSINPGGGSLSAATGDVLVRMQHQGTRLKKKGMIYTLSQLSELEASIKWSGNSRVMVEVALLKLCNSQALVQEDITGLVERVDALEKKLTGAKFALSPVEIVETVRKNVKTEINSKPEIETATETISAPDPETKAAAKTETPQLVATDEETEEDSGSSENEWKLILKEIGRREKTLEAQLKDTRTYMNGDAALTIIFRNELRFFMNLCCTGKSLEIIKTVVNEHFKQEMILKFVTDKDFVKPFEKESFRKPMVTEEKQVLDVLDKIRELSEKHSIPLKIID